MTSPLTGGFTRYESIRDEIANEINSGVYPAGALLPSIREIMQRWQVSTTTARRVLDELAAAGYARKEGTRGHISTGGPPTGQAPAGLTPARQAPASQGPVSGRLTIRPTHTIPAGGSILPDAHTHIAALDVRAEPAPPDAALALRLPDPNQPVIVRRQLMAAADGTPVQLRTSYLRAHLAENTPLAQPEPIPEPWTTALADHLGGVATLIASHITARHPTHGEGPALALPLDAVVIVREDTHHDDHGTPIDFTRTVWPGETTRLSATSLFG
jgi:DNA-binding GntR family transcriptional regulator